MSKINVIAEAPGVVWKIEAGEGKTVTADDPILILESMKMEIPVPAPTGGTVTEVMFAEGETVEEGDVVAIIDDQ